MPTHVKAEESAPKKPAIKKSKKKQQSEETCIAILTQAGLTDYIKTVTKFQPMEKAEALSSLLVLLKELQIAIEFDESIVTTDKRIQVSPDFQWIYIIVLALQEKVVPTEDAAKGSAKISRKSFQLNLALKERPLEVKLSVKSPLPILHQFIRLASQADLSDFLAYVLLDEKYGFPFHNKDISSELENFSTQGAQAYAKFLLKISPSNLKAGMKCLLDCKVKEIAPEDIAEICTQGLSENRDLQHASYEMYRLIAEAPDLAEIKNSLKAFASWENISQKCAYLAICVHLQKKGLLTEDNKKKITAQFIKATEKTSFALWQKVESLGALTQETFNIFMQMY